MFCRGTALLAVRSVLSKKPAALSTAVIRTIPIRTLTFKPLYTAEATANGGRNGTVKTSDGLLDLQLALPTGLGGPGGAKSNPEQLFAAGYSACFLGALHLVAGKAKITLPASTTVNGHVHIGRHDGSLLLEVELKVYAPDVDKTKLMELVESAHKVCPYSLATRGNVKVHLQSYSHKM